MEIASTRRTLRATSAGRAAALTLLALTLTASACRRHSGPTPAAAPADAAPPAGSVLEGRVVDRADHPIPEARVLAFALAASGVAGPAQTTTDPEGHFRLERLRPGDYRVLVEADGFPALEKIPVAAPGAALALRLDGEGRSIVGRVLSGGAPAAGARVFLRSDAGGPPHETTARATGGFAFGGLGEGRYALRAASGTLASATVAGVEAGDAAGAKPFVLELGPGQAATGRVIDDAGGGVPSIDVRVEVSGEGQGGDPVPSVVRSDLTGGFSTGALRPGAYRLSVARPGHLLRRAPVVTVAAPPAPAPPAVTLELVRGARVTGRVRDGRGSPAGGARVRCVSSALADLTVVTGPLPLAAEAAAMPSGAGRALGSTRAASADRDGRFTVDDLIPGRYRIEIVHPGAEPFRGDELTLAPGDRRDLGVLALRAGLTATGRVVDASGAGIDGARVTVAGVEGSAGAPGLQTATDASGRFGLALPAGKYRVSATAPGHGAAQATLNLSPGVAPASVELKLVRAEATLEGLVRDDGGRPLARARLIVSGPELSSSPVGGGTADVGGHFSIPQLPSGELRLEIHHPDYPASVEAVTSGKFATITVPFPGGVSGEVRARVTGAAVVRARIEAFGPGGAKATADVAKAGSFRLLRLMPGRWRLTATAPGFRAGERELDVSAASALGEASVRDVRVELDPT